MARVLLQFDEATFQRFSQYLSDIPGAIESAGKDALNKSMVSGRAFASKELSAVMGANQAGIRKRITFLKATKRNVSASIIVRGGKGPNLITFAARETAQGVTARIFGQAQQFRSRFITRGIGKKAEDFNLGATGARIVTHREGAKRAMTKGAYAGRKILRGPRAGQPLLREPLKADYGPSVAETFEMTPGLEDGTIGTIESVMGKNLEHETDYQLSKVR